MKPPLFLLMYMDNFWSSGTLQHINVGVELVAQYLDLPVLSDKEPS